VQLSQLLHNYIKCITLTEIFNFETIISNTTSKKGYQFWLPRYINSKLSVCVCYWVIHSENLLKIVAIIQQT